MRGRSGARESRKLSDSADRIRTLAEKQLESAGSFILPQYKKLEAVVTEIVSDPDIVSMTDNVNRKISEKMQLFPYLELVYLTDGKGIQISANIFRDRDKAESGLSRQNIAINKIMIKQITPGYTTNLRGWG